MFGLRQSRCDGIDFLSAFVTWHFRQAAGPHKYVVKLEGPRGWSIQLTGALKINEGLSDGGAVTWNTVCYRHTNEWCLLVIGRFSYRRLHPADIAFVGCISHQAWFISVNWAYSRVKSILQQFTQLRIMVKFIPVNILKYLLYDVCSLQMRPAEDAAFRLRNVHWLQKNFLPKREGKV